LVQLTILKEELENINTSLNKKEESWQFTISRDSSGNMSSINAKRLK